LAFIWLRFSELSVNAIVFLYSLIYSKKNKKGEINSIGAYWYYPPDLTGSNLRLGGWKEYFEKDGFLYDNFHINSFKEWSAIKASGSWTKKYFYFSRCLWLRLPQMLKAHKYDVIWIDRSLIPFYPRKSALLERRLKKVVSKMVVDSTDGGDFQSNPNLMKGVFDAADELTVGYKYLKEHYGKSYKVTQVFWTISQTNYLVKTDYSFKSELPIIGWMGSPGNFEHVKGIIPILKEVFMEVPFVFKYICRDDMSSYLGEIKSEQHFFGEDYYTILGSFDIGLCPFLEINLRTQGKIAMKHQEFLLMGVPQICSNVAISEFVQHGKEVLIANQIEDWKNNLIKLLKDESIRKELGMNSRDLFLKYYQYEGQYPILKQVLTQNNPS
jgi:glycosyltransferase involved in cell wall biosynthesis